MILLTSLVAENRWLVLFLLFHVLGVHWLAGAKSWWMKLPAGICLASVPFCWIKAFHLSPSNLGLNSHTAVAVASLVLLAGLWLFLAGKGPVEWLGGFSAAVFGGAGVLFSIGQHW